MSIIGPKQLSILKSVESGPKTYSEIQKDTGLLQPNEMLTKLIRRGLVTHDQKGQPYTITDRGLKLLVSYSSTGPSHESMALQTLDSVANTKARARRELLGELKDVRNTLIDIRIFLDSVIEKLTPPEYATDEITVDSLTSKPEAPGT